MRRMMLLLWTLTAGLMLGSCSFSSAETVHQQVTQTVPAGTSPIVHLQNGAGIISIQPSNQLQVSVQATKSANSSQALRDISVDVRTQGSKVYITTKYAGLPHGGVSYTIAVPADASLDVQNGAGPVAIGRVHGNISAVAKAGGITADVGTVAGTRAIVLRTSAGSIRLSIAAGSSARIQAHSSVGRFTSDFPTLHEQRAGVVSANGTGSIGSGSAHITLFTATGEIVLIKSSR